MNPKTLKTNYKITHTVLHLLFMRILIFFFQFWWQRSRFWRHQIIALLILTVDCDYRCWNWGWLCKAWNDKAGLTEWKERNGKKNGKWNGRYGLTVCAISFQCTAQTIVLNPDLNFHYCHNYRWSTCLWLNVNFRSILIFATD